MTGGRGRARVFAPATVSNLSCGYDLLGFALAEWGDVVEATAIGEPGVRIVEIEGDDGRLPREAAANTAGVAARRLLELVGAADAGVELRLEKGLPIASGLGSSGASAVGAVVAVDAALGLEAEPDVLLTAAIAGEAAAAGEGHPDNVAPALLGGLLLIRSGEPPRVTPLPVAEDLFAVVYHPRAEVATAEARAVLPSTVPLATLTRQAGNLAALVAGLFRDDDELIAGGLVDEVAEPARATLNPGLAACRQAALAAGALGAGLSGSGPALYALVRDRERAGRVGDAMRVAHREATGLDGRLLVSPVGAEGARLVGSRPAGGDPT